MSLDGDKQKEVDSGEPASRNGPGMMSRILNTVGLPRLTVGGFVVVLFVLGRIMGLPLTNLLTNSISRFGMNAVMVLAMVPGIQCGIGPNFGLPIGLLAGLIGMVSALELGFIGFEGLMLSMAIGAGLGALLGIGYGLFLNKVKGQEMMVGTYAGFAAVSLMCISWLMLPFKNPELIWVLGGKGLRMTISLKDTFGHALDKFWNFQIGGFVVPTGLLGVVFILAAAYKLFEMTKLGMAMDLAGQNERFARAAGVDCDRMRVVGTAISTALGAIGIIVYAQSYGFIQLYTAPLLMAFPAVASVLIGGATPSEASVSNAMVGALLFQSLLATTVPVAQTVVGGDISEIVRLIVSNGMVLYALTRGHGGEAANG
ncbi:MAG: ABC transporter permease subunit [Bacillota bacterium]|jgi:simple sugar transport system permease protein